MRRISTSTEFRLIPILLAALVAFAAGCASNTEPVEEPDPSETASEFEDAAPTPPPIPEVENTNVSNMNLSISPVYFDLDESTIKAEYESILQSAATALRDSGASIVIEGHCDERGSEEYNIALGERRAGSVRTYLYNLGVPTSQMSVVSYGEARPAASGMGESVYQLNRRVQFTIR